MQSHIAFLGRVKFHQREIDNPNERVFFLGDQIQFFTQVEAQIAQRVVNDLSRVGRKQNDVADLGFGDFLDLLLLCLREKFCDRRLPAFICNLGPGDALGAEGGDERRHVIQILTRQLSTFGDADAFHHAAFFNRRGKNFCLAIA